MEEVGARYDVVGVDPRFVGRSTPLDCHWPTGSMVRGAGGDRAGFDRMVAFPADLARRCRTHAGDLLPYATTRDTARDMDVIRAALGEHRISYLGYSYGSYPALSGTRRGNVRRRSAATPPALLVNATGDPRTTYQSAQAVHRRWPSSRLVTLRGADQHPVYGVFGSSCVDAAVNAYLADGRPPASDITCLRPTA
ncbi:alpha/beta fold hydrolase [Streptomyces sp. NPDC006314]|uniref:alpha/beta hydrolase n=1 Tax=Streptomyces sp. NPDC006314 TaxID=3154475 RepID=UPI0033AEA30D